MKTLTQNPSERRLLYLVQEVAAAVDLSAQEMRERLIIALTMVQTDALQGEK